MSLRVQEDVIRLEVSMYDPLRMDVSQCTSQFGNPEPHCFLGEAFPRDMESQIAAIHEIHNDVTEVIRIRKIKSISMRAYSHMYSTS